MRGANSSRATDGILLPAALFLTLALGAAAISILALARGERIAERQALAYLRDRVSTESALRSVAGSPTPEEGDPELVTLAGGYLLALAGRPAGGPHRAAVLWRLVPDSVAAGFPAMAEVGASPVSANLGLLGESCPDGVGSGPIIRVRSPAVLAAEPPLPPGPRVGPLGVDRLVALTEASLPLSGVLPEAEGTSVLLVPPGVVATVGDAMVVLISEGDLSVGGTAIVRGLLVAAGDVEVSGAAQVEGIVLAGGSVRTLDEGRILGCRAHAVAALAHPNLARVHTLPGGERLGRF